MLKRYHTGIILALISTITYACAGFFGIQLMQQGLSISNMLVWRFTISSILMGLLSICIKQNFKIENKNYKPIIYSMLSYSLSTITFFISCEKLGTALATILLFTYPAMVILANIIRYKQKINTQYYLSFILLILGMLLIMDFRDSNFDFNGILMGLIAAVFYAIYIIINDKDEINPYVSTSIVLTGCAIIFIIFAYFDNSLTIPSPSTWVTLSLMTIIATIIPMLVILAALKYISAEQVSIISLIEPIFVIIIAKIFLNEQINHIQVIGTIIMLYGAYIAIKTS